MAKKQIEINTGLFAEGPIVLEDEPVKARTRLDPKYCAQALRISELKNNHRNLRLLVLGIHKVCCPSREPTVEELRRLEELVELWRDTPMTRQNFDGDVYRNDMSAKAKCLRDAIEKHYAAHP